MVSTVFDIQKFKRSALTFGLEALQKLRNHCGMSPLVGLGYRIIVNK